MTTIEKQISAHLARLAADYLTRDHGIAVVPSDEDEDSTDPFVKVQRSCVHTYHPSRGFETRASSLLATIKSLPDGAGPDAIEVALGVTLGHADQCAG